MLTAARVKQWRPLLPALLASVALKAALLAAGVVPFNSDEAVVALMARHILQGERPIFFYGQAYMGSLDAWLVAGAFAVFGEAVWAVRAVQILLYLGTVATLYALALKIYADPWIAHATAWLAAIPTVLVTLYTTISLGDYGETLLLGNGLLWLALQLREEPHARRWWALLGLGIGLGLWIFPLMGVYVLPVLVYVFWLSRPPRWPPFVGHWVVLSIGGLIGALPLWAHIAQHGWAALSEAGGAAIAGASNASPLAALGQRVLGLVLFGMMAIIGLRPPWSVEFLALPLAPLALAVCLAALGFAVRRLLPSPFQGRSETGPGTRVGRGLILGVWLTLALAFVLTPFGADPSGRYFLPLAMMLTLLTAEMLCAVRSQKAWLANALLLGLLAFNLWGNVQSALAFPPGLTTQFDEEARVDQRDLPALMTFLREQGETRGYASYWVTFPLAFLSNDELIFAARLPYHSDFRYTPRDDRYAPYTEAVTASPHVAYIAARHPLLDERLRLSFAALGVTFTEKRIGDFVVFYALSRRVAPEELGLGQVCCEAP